MSNEPSGIREDKIVDVGVLHGAVCILPPSIDEKANSEKNGSGEDQ